MPWRLAIGSAALAVGVAIVVVEQPVMEPNATAVAAARARSLVFMSVVPFKELASRKARISSPALDVVHNWRARTGAMNEDDAGPCRRKEPRSSASSIARATPRGAARTRAEAALRARACLPWTDARNAAVARAGTCARSAIRAPACRARARG